MATLSSIITPSNITTATNTQTLTNKTLTGAAMNGTLGATTPSTVAATTLSASGASSFPNSAPSVIGGFGFRNRIINGDMRIDQRNEGASITNAAATVAFPVDRFFFYGTSASKFSAQRNAASVTPPAGFTNYVGITSLAATTPGSTDIYSLYHRIEGLNVSDLGFGAAGAKTVTLSFWVRSSLTGSFGGTLINSAGNRSYPYSYTISSANTWELKTVVVGGDTSGTWLTTNGVGLGVQWDLGSGSTLRSTAGSWQAGAFLAPTGATNVIGTSGATLYITGVQLEVGNAATEFERMPFSTALNLCRRYAQVLRVDESINNYGPYAVGFNTSTTNARTFTAFATRMRVAPSVGYSALADFIIVDGIGNVAPTAVTRTSASPEICMIDWTYGFTSTSGIGVYIAANNRTTGSLTFDSEL